MSFWESLFGWRLDSNESNYQKINHIFSVWHFVALGLIIGAIITLCLVARKKDKKWQNRMFLIIGIILLALEILRIIYRTIIYVCYETYLPDNTNIYNWAEIISFALCTMVAFFLIVTLLINKEKWNNFAYEAIFPIAIFSGSAALIYPDMLNTYYPIYHIMNIQTLITHGLLVAVPFLFIATKRLQPKIKNFWKPMVTIFGFSIIAIIFSRLANCSFMYMNNGIEVIPGWENKPLYSYYWILALVFAAWVALCYLPFVIKDFVAKRKSAKNNSPCIKNNAVIENEGNIEEQKPVNNKKFPSKETKIKTKKKTPEKKKHLKF